MPKALPSTEHNSAPHTHTQNKTEQNLAKDNLGGRGQKINSVFSTCSSQGSYPSSSGWPTLIPGTQSAVCSRD